MFKKKPGDDTGMQTRVWGPAGWLFLHSIAQNYPWKPTIEQKEWYYNFFKLVGNVLPCKYCRESYQEFITQPGTLLSINTMKNRMSVVKWLYHVHNKVNKKLGIKNNFTLQETINKYESFRSKCHKSPEILNKIKKGCLDPMKGSRKRCFISVENVDKDGNTFGKKKVNNEEFINAMNVLNVIDKNDKKNIKNKYRKLSMIYHPDRPMGDETKFKEINNAYHLLMNKTKKTHFGKKKNLKLISIKKSLKKNKKFMATFDINGRKKIIYFGAAGASDYTKHKDITRRNRYIFRHKKDFKTNDPSRAGYLSMFVLWNKPSLQSGIADYRRRLNSYNRTGKFLTNISKS